VGYAAHFEKGSTSEMRKGKAVLNIGVDSERADKRLISQKYLLGMRLPH
jgi:hypothetical protein